jgi:uncharacterized membrane protein
MNAFSRFDWMALALWAICWFAYALVADKMAIGRSSLMSSSVKYRRKWMQECYLRDNRMIDIATIGNLMHSATFFTSTTLLILGALFALIGSIEKGADVIGDVVQGLPFAIKINGALMEMKAVVLALTFVYAFLRFTWSIRQFNLLNIIVGAFPADKENNLRDDGLIEKAARLSELAGSNFTHALRAYYFAVPILLWIVNPWMFVVGTVGITLATFLTEFKSDTVRALG